MKLVSISQNTQEKIGEVELTHPDEVKDIVFKAKTVQKEWASLPIRKKIEFLKSARKILYNKSEALAKLISEENGKPFFESISTEIIPTLSLFDYYIKNSEKFLRPHYERIKLPVMIHKKSWIEYVPYGVIGIISPWNYPLLLPMGQIIPALVSGNTIVFKPSEWTPLTGEFISLIFSEANIPSNVFNVIYGTAEVGNALVNSDIDKLFFTGSTQVGRIIAKNCAEKLLPFSLELEGKDPAIVLNDADLKRAAKGIAWGAIMNAGQTCVSVERVYVQSKIYFQFIEELKKVLANLRNYDQSNFYDYGNIKLDKQVSIIKDHLNDALSKGAQIYYGSHITNNFVEPTILVNVNHSMKVMKEETFGPIIPIQKFDTIEEAIELANDCDYGLSVSVWTKNISKGKEVAKKIYSGSVLINDCISYFGTPEAVVGGIKFSGSGRVHSKSGIMEMVYEKYYSSDSFTWQKKLWWFNYGEKETKNILEALNFLFGKNIFKRILSGIKIFPLLFKKE